jgi:hypothetical protein
MIKNYILALFTALFCQFSFGQSNYSVSPIPFQQFTATLPVQGTQDDINSNVIQLPFSFDFYGVTYNQIVVSTNGYIDFRTTSANQFSPWSFTQSVPAADFPVKNSILGCFHDMNNNTGLGYINYGIYGTAPYRKFVVVFNNNPQFSCTTATSTIQMILYESQSIIDIQLIDKQLCSTWNGGRAVTGLINLAGTTGITAPGRNTGAWTAFHEGWRFTRSGYTTGDYQFVKCDGNSDGIEDFNLQVVQNDLVANGAPGLTFYTTLTDLQTHSNPISGLTYTNLTSPQTIYTMYNGAVKSVVLTVIDCGVDYDADTVATNSEDPNNDTNLANDDTDMDGLPNYLDNDDDGDLVLTNVEYVFTNKNVSALLDTDNDGKPNYLDKDDDGDGVLTFMEDYNGDGNPANDDTNNNGVVDYIDPFNILATDANAIENAIKLFPNPVSEILNIENTSNYNVSNVSIYSINGALVKEINSQNSIQTIPVSDLQTGLYFVKIQLNDEVKNFKFIKK